MNLFRQLKTIFAQPQQAPLAQIKKSGLRSNSFELIVDQILDQGPSQDFIILGDQNQNQKEIQQQGIQNMYIKDFLLIGKKCEGRSLTIQQWEEIIKSSDLANYSKKDLYFSIFKGIDYKIRKNVWNVLANTTQMRKLTKLTFQELSDTNSISPSELDMIDKDVRRTEALTKYLPQLRKILIAYVSLSKKSYVQGMNVIGGILLRLLAIDNDKQFQGHSIIQQELSERVFWVLMGVMKWKSWADLFQKDLSGLNNMLQILRSLMQDHVPKILKIIDLNQWDLGIFAQYYVTICLYNCPLELAPMILDLFLLDGQIVVHSFLIRMMVVNQSKILSFKDESKLMKYLKSQMLADTYSKILKNRSSAQRLQDFEINFLKTAF